MELSIILNVRGYRAALAQIVKAAKLMRWCVFPQIMSLMTSKNVIGIMLGVGESPAAVGESPPAVGESPPAVGESPVGHSPLG